MYLFKGQGKDNVRTPVVMLRVPVRGGVVGKLSLHQWLSPRYRTEVPREYLTTTLASSKDLNKSSKPHHALVYHEYFSINPIQHGHRFPMPKDSMLYEALMKEHGMVPLVLTPSMPSTDDICLVHDPIYVHRFIDGTLSEKEMRSIGLPWSPELVKRTLIGVGSAITAAQYAVENQSIAVMCNGGTHHAHADHGSGWCIFNDQAVSCRYVQKYHGVGNVLFIDLDVHLNDGTASIFQSCSRTYLFSMHGASQSFPAVKYKNNTDIEVPAGCTDDEYMSLLKGSPLEDIMDRYSFDLVLYNAGVDVHQDDSLGSLALTDQGIEDRDRYVLELCISRRIPLAVALGGGYAANHHDIVRRHLILHRVLKDLSRHSQ